METAPRRPAAPWRKAVLFGAAYWACAEASLSLSFRSGTFATLWMPAGLYVGVLIMSRPPRWPLLIAVAMAVNTAFDIFHGTPPVLTAAFAILSALEAIIGASLFRRFVTRTPRGDVMAEFLGLVVCSAVCGAVPVCAGNAWVLVASGFSHSFMGSWMTSVTGDSIAILSIAPFVMIWSNPAETSRRWWKKPGRLAEASALVAATIAILAFLVPREGIEDPYTFVLLPFVLWAALRFGVRGSSAVNLLVAVLLVYAASHSAESLQTGPSLQWYIATLYGFLAVSSAVGLIPAIAVEERTRLLESLGNSEDRFRTLAAAAREGVVISEKGIVLDANDQMLKILGKGRPEIVGFPVTNLLPVGSGPEVAQRIAADQEAQYAPRIPQRDGSHLELEVRAKMLQMGERKLRMTTVRDVTERKQSDVLLSGQYQVLEMIAASRPLEEVLSTLVRVVESQFGQLVGSVLLKDGDRLRHVAAPGMPFDFIQAIDGIRIAEDEGSCGAAAFSRQPVFVRDIALDPRFVKYATLARSLGFRASWSAPILDGKQRLLGTLGLYSRQTGLPTPRQRKVIDTAAHTASVAISRSLDEAALKLSDFSVNHASTPTLWVSRSGRFVRVNRATCHLLGYTEAEIFEMRVTDLHPFFNPEDWDEHWRKTRESQRLTFEAKLRRKDGSLIRVDVNINWFEFEGEEYHFVFYHDITARHQLEEGLRQSQKMDAIGQLSGGIAHDFNNLLTVIRGNLGMMRISGPLPRNIADCVDELEGAVNRATKLTGQLLAFGRKQVMRPEELDLNRVVETFADLIRRVIVEAIVVQVDLCANGLYVSADGSMLEQVMLNLCLNARDAMPKGGKIVLATATVTVDAEEAERMPSGRPGTFARLTVADSGTGISPENLAHVFEPFFTTKEVGKGTGLGLASVYGILQQHGGWVTVQSDAGQGTTFGIYLPLLATGFTARELPEAGALGPAGGETVLLVEDNPDVRSYTNKALALMGYRVLIAENGEAAGTLWARHSAEIDVLLTDVMMPGELGGLDVARSLRALDPALKVVFMSGYSADIAREDFDEAAGEYFLSKPFELTELASTLRRCLAGRS
jgi:PAS domain S-box-containing protein